MKLEGALDEKGAKIDELEQRLVDLESTNAPRMSSSTRTSQYFDLILSFSCFNSSFTGFCNSKTSLSSGLGAPEESKASGPRRLPQSKVSKAKSAREKVHMCCTFNKL